MVHFVVEHNFAINNDIVARCNLLCFGVNFDQILLNKIFQKRIIFIQNNYIAAARLIPREPRVQLWLTLINANSAENIYILCENPKKMYKQNIFKKIYV